MLKKLNKYFTTYEKIWLSSIIILTIIFSILFPEEDVNGINGSIILLLYILDSIFNVFCELLISKQSKWNFIVSLLVEITEILICIVCAYRFSTLLSTIFFWIPIDIISFINWNKHKDKDDEELTVVRKLSKKKAILCILFVIVFTIIVGTLTSKVNITTTLFNSKNVDNLVDYIDACVTILGIFNGLFILFRLREQWIAWYIYSILELIINILSGQYILIILKLAFLTNTTYGYIKWTKYIKDKKTEIIN